VAFGKRRRPHSEYPVTRSGFEPGVSWWRSRSTTNYCEILL